MTTDPFAPKPNSTKVATKWALINTGVAIVFTLLFDFMKVDVNSPAKYITYIPFIAFMVLTQLEYRKLLGDSLTYGQSFSSGFRYAVFTGLLTGIFTYIYIAFINPAMITQVQDAQRAAMEEKNMSEEQIDQAMSMASKMTSPAMFALFAAVGSAIFGAIVSLITSIFTKKEPQPFDGSDYQEPAV
ncbi:DUF4199 domain-containing protein [Mucilaginibacter myungsuensis]|uniref:DUF4199 domain-containing protein n=1 Tax=Mucilaginibacter myungsuensis TaxID=649104 RepID=A0A929KTJ6_9SPHI|nr:DUF4199 domain-containing protein [Mucilaginibacter myungsuensis]MBE9660912.1 DUF4199 domain-containing protein [Mucilaginibacter myungsuensis]MDN3600958.1 DUF4199 domain-containing protein [Mucilaginibacter myungsuensis]